MKILLAENAQGYATAVADYSTKASLLQTALTAYVALGLAAVPTTADLPDLWQRPDMFLERMITGGQAVTIGGGLTLKPGQVFDLIEKPSGWEGFLTTVSELRSGRPQVAPADLSRFGNSDSRRAAYLATMNNPDYWTSPGVEPSQYELSGGTVRVKQAVLDSVRESYRIYATTQQQKDEWDVLQTIAGALETLRQSGRFGARFDAPEYLKKALVSQGVADIYNPVQVDAANVVNPR